MYYTEGFFRVPIRIYDRYSMIKADDIEKNEDAPAEGDWIAGYIKIKPSDIDWWSDYYDSVQGVEGVKESGFHYTMVMTIKGDHFISVWDRKDFESNLNTFVENLNNKIIAEKEQKSATIALTDKKPEE